MLSLKAVRLCPFFFSEYKLVVVKNEEDQLSKLSDKSLKKACELYGRKSQYGGE